MVDKGRPKIPMQTVWRNIKKKGPIFMNPKPASLHEKIDGCRTFCRVVVWIARLALENITDDRCRPCRDTARRPPPPADGQDVICTAMSSEGRWACNSAGA
ncbi:hypothetical protein EVAR_34502_1 [Eumeta japonica]|uniref:Uncharacterized protein n=1 Tax=Eumeta variegata TaxID=151549 RepID=A0A4C1Z7G3_EUMVA|nr:hypothetical protein EVAR_34502_1 [Eumeta japonica]